MKTQCLSAYVAASRNADYEAGREVRVEMTCTCGHVYVYLVHKGASGAPVSHLDVILDAKTRQPFLADPHGA